MINPIGVNSLNKYSGLETKKSDEKSSFNARETELYPLNYKVGRAFAGMSGITFKNLAKPVEVTNLYNKKAEGKDHLDLPNIHVYEFPDTNLQVVVNADKNIKTDDNSVLYNPKLSIVIENNNEDIDPVKEKILFYLIQNKLKNANFTGNNNCFMYSTSFAENAVKSMEDFNKIFFNLNFTENDAAEAKQELLKYLDSPEYENSSKNAKALYNKKDLKSKEEIEVEINNITANDMKKFYQEYLDLSTVSGYATVSNEYFEAYKQELLSAFNKNINETFLKNGEVSENNQEFVPNNEIKICYGTDSNSLEFPVPMADSKDSLISDITALILNFDDDFAKRYKLRKETFLQPIELKNDAATKYHNTLFKFEILQNSAGENNQVDVFKSDLNNICSKDLSENLEQAKEYLKDRLKKTFTGERMDLIKNWELTSYGNSVFDTYEKINLINQDDVKRYINFYMVKQQPIIMTCSGENKNADR